MKKTLCACMAAVLALASLPVLGASAEETTYALGDHLRKQGRHLVQLLPAVLHPAVGGLFFQRLPGSISQCLPGLHLLCSKRWH